MVPASLKINWEQEVRKWASGLGVRRVLGDSDDRLATYMLPIPVLVVSYEQLRDDAPSIGSDINFDIVILDEAQRIKNSNSLVAMACKLVSRSRSWAPTGTPVENSAEDLEALFSFIKPGLIHSHMPRSLIHDRIRPYFLRRLKRDVLAEMPPILIQDITLELEAEQREAYSELWDQRAMLLQENGRPVSEVHLLALITRLKQLCNFEPQSQLSVKMNMLDDVLESLDANCEKCLIFSQYVKTLDFISSRVNMPHAIYHGGLSEVERSELLQRFERNNGSFCLLVSLKAGGVGLNLNAASTVILFDRWWNPAVENQAIQRAHRFGRSRPLQVIRFIVRDTIEERISEVLNDKSALFEDYVEGAESWSPNVFDRSEMRRLLQLGTSDVD